MLTVCMPLYCCWLCLQAESGWRAVPGRAVLSLLCEAVGPVERSFCQASVHWWEVLQVGG